MDGGIVETPDGFVARAGLRRDIAIHPLESRSFAIRRDRYEMIACRWDVTAIDGNGILALRRREYSKGRAFEGIPIWRGLGVVGRYELFAAVPMNEAQQRHQ